MKVLLINGSRREKYCTYTALNQVANELENNGIETEIFFIGDKIFDGKIDATVRLVAEKMKTADGLVLGSPVYYASASGEMLAFLDRFCGIAAKDLYGKPCACVCSARRAGTTATLDTLNKYPMFAGMPLVSSTYWNMVHGNTPDEVMQDAEGLQIMQYLGKNMAWMLKCINIGKENGILVPAIDSITRTNFIR